MTQRNILSFLPKVSKQFLLYEAALVWLFASFMLSYRAYLMLPKVNLFVFLACIIGGIFFYVLMFVRISGKHIRRIQTLKDDSRHILAFFNAKGYIMMACMIGLGILLRSTGLIPITPLAYFYFFMATPLFLSAVRFFYYALIS